MLRRLQATGYRQRAAGSGQRAAGSGQQATAYGLDRETQSVCLLSVFFLF
jgi:hypothetical protein